MNLSLKRLASILVTAVFAALPFAAIWQRQAIFDAWRLNGYTPSAEISRLVERTTMTDDGKHLFYVYHAQLQEKEDFNANCRNTEQSIVLGCYVDGQGIYIYNVTDERLAGVQEVTSAHEMLHAAYERLGKKERARVDALTQGVLDNVTNQRILDSIKAYRDRDPSVVPNELHSIVGTEIRDIPAELETYYSQYFKDRKSVVSFSEKYEQAFTERQQKADQIVKQIEALKSEIDSLDASLTSSRAALEQEYAQLQADRANAEPNSYNARVRAYNASVQAYNASVQYSYALIDQHNALVAEYNQVVLEEKELIKAIDSRPATISQ